MTGHEVTVTMTATCNGCGRSATAATAEGAARSIRHSSGLERNDRVRLNATGIFGVGVVEHVAANGGLDEDRVRVYWPTAGQRTTVRGSSLVRVEDDEGS